jgi:hypothetical protein
MTDSTLVPERQLAFSPGLAQTIGLEEAILLQHLDGVCLHQPPRLHDGYSWHRVRRDWLLHTLPFWDTDTLQRITRSLVDKGLLLVEGTALRGDPELVFAFNQRHQTNPHPAPPPHPAPTPASGSRRAGILPTLWSPSEDMLELLDLNHSIPRQFAMAQLEDFVLYWRERGEVSHAWENKFRQHVISRWRHQQQQQAEAFRQREVTLEDDWQPSADALEILARAGVSRDFIEDAVPEFVLYWREQAQAPRALNATFVTHVRRQWARFTSATANDTEPRPISADWRPAADVFDILALSHIDAQFARNLIPEFVMYWLERGDAQASWNTRFLQHVKYHWAKTHQMQQSGQDHGGQQGHRRTANTRTRSLEDDLTDRSWAQ